MTTPSIGKIHFLSRQKKDLEELHDINKLKNIDFIFNDFKEINSSRDNLSFLETHIDQPYSHRLDGQDKLIKKEIKIIASKLSDDEIKMAKIMRKIADIDRYRFTIKRVSIRNKIYPVGVLISRNYDESCFVFFSSHEKENKIDSLSDEGYFLESYKDKNKIIIRYEINDDEYFAAIIVRYRENKK